MIALLARWWRRTNRRNDMRFLWPACLEHAESLNDARRAFFLHIANDPAWTTDYTPDELVSFVDALRGVPK